MAFNLNIGSNPTPTYLSVTPTSTPKIIVVSVGINLVGLPEDIVNQMLSLVQAANNVVGANIYNLIQWEVNGVYDPTLSDIVYYGIGYAQNLRDFPVITQNMIR